MPEERRIWVGVSGDIWQQHRKRFDEMGFFWSREWRCMQKWVEREDLQEVMERLRPTYIHGFYGGTPEIFADIIGAQHTRVQLNQKAEEPVDWLDIADNGISE